MDEENQVWYVVIEKRFLCGAQVHACEGCIQCEALWVQQRFPRAHILKPDSQLSTPAVTVLDTFRCNGMKLVSVLLQDKCFLAQLGFSIEKSILSVCI